MAHHTIETDYLIVGSGAVGMAFADILLAETDASITIVDRHHKPGGHWNDAYSFVCLHQPSAFYGVASRELSQGRKDEVGLNKGLHELASGAEVSAYFDQVMRHQFLPSGRVQYFPMCDYTSDKADAQNGKGEFRSIAGGDTYDVKVAKKTVDATYFKTSVPSTHTPSYTWDAGIDVQPLNALPGVKSSPAGYMVVGGGKTGIDACLWLLENGVHPDDIQWVMPRDGWLIDRANTQPSEEFFSNTMGAQAAQMEAIAAATSIDDLFDRLERAGVLLRIDTTVKPEMYHGATISQQEMAELRRIKNIIRMGRIKHIGTDEITFEKGTLPATPGTMYVDCSARAVPVTEMFPVFDGNLITIQTVRTIQPVFSAALIAHIEAAYEDEKYKKSLCSVVPLPNAANDWIIVTMGLMMNQFTWSQDRDLRNWIASCRLDGFGRMIKNVDPEDTEKMAILGRMKAAAMPAMANLQKFAVELGEGGT